LVELHIPKYKNSTLDPCVARDARVGDLVGSKSTLYLLRLFSFVVQRYLKINIMSIFFTDLDLHERE